MTDKKQKEKPTIGGKIKAGINSLRIRFFLILVISIGVGIGIYFIVHFSSYRYINNVYASVPNKESREKAYLEDLQEFVIRNDVSSEDMRKVSEWVKSHKYVYLLLSKDDEIFYTSDDADKKDDVDIDDPDDPDGGDKNKEDEKEPGGITIDYPTREELLADAAKKDQHPIEFADGTMLASVTDFTEYLYYDVANIASIIVALLFVIIAITGYFHFVTNRIIRLGSDVNKVAEGDMNYKIKAKGNDEISKLSVNVDNMRTSMIENFKKEREALDSNTALITSMSHDIRTPLTVLLGYIDIIKTKTHGDEEMENYLSAAESTAMRLKKLSDDMFNYFLVFGGKEMEISIESYDAATLIGQMLSEHILLMKESGYEVDEKTDFAELIGHEVSTDAQKLIRIFDNIFSNIYKYADKNSPVSISFEKIDNKIYLCFSNAVSKDKSRVESNGIGLKTCKKLGEYIGADFNAHESEGIFTVTVALNVNKT